MAGVFVLAGQSNMAQNHARLEMKLKERYGTETIVIQAAVGGTSITQWQRGQTPFNNCIAQADEALAIEGNEPKAVLFFQGERDTINETALQWKSLFWASMRDLRVDMGSPYMPVVYAVLGAPPVGELYNGEPVSRPYWMDVHNQQKAAIENHTAFQYFGTWDIPRIPANVHYEDAGYEAIAQRFMAKLANLGF